MNDPNDDLADKVELALKIVELQKEIAELKRRFDPPYLPPVPRNDELQDLLRAGARRVRQENFTWWLGLWCVVIFVGAPILVLLFVH